jgi:hypothetical protein
VAALAAAAVLGVAGAVTPTHGAALHATHAQRSPAAFAPVVIEWFSVVSPRAGSHDTVYARFVNNNQPVRGASLTAVVSLGSRTLAKVHGTKTGAKGVAHARISIPASAAGKSLIVTTVLKYNKQSYQGKNLLKVKK